MYAQNHLESSLVRPIERVVEEVNSLFYENIILICIRYIFIEKIILFYVMLFKYTIQVYQ